MTKYFIAIIILLSFNTYAQIDHEYFVKNREVYFKFQLNSIEDLSLLIQKVSIDNIKNGVVFAYANEEEFNSFLQMNYAKPHILPHPGDVPDIRMSADISEVLDWNVYPTYDAYVQMMNNFAAQYPSICKLIEAGTTIQGRKILFVKISDNVNIRESEPQVMFSSTIHGDEATGYVLMLRLIDSLLTSYGTSSRITNFINNMEIWINPNANPDGTYYGGNHTVSGARRFNANSVDINRNFPDPAAGPHPDGKAWQPETIAMMNLAQTNRFVLSVNFHGGAEVVNYPWDTWARLHPDNNWWIWISRCYADTVHKYAPSTYLRDLNNGITNGCAWYRITGGRQDYFTYFARGREVTIEISATKLISASLLPAHWEYNKRSFLDYMEKSLYGINGVVTNQLGNPVKAKITVVGFDFDQSEIYSDSLTGFYVRMIQPGTYSLKFEADSCVTQVINNITVSNYNLVNLNVQLQSYVPVELTSFTAYISERNVQLYWETASEKNNRGFELERKNLDQGFSHKKESKDWNFIAFIKGNGTSTKKTNYFWEDKNLQPGIYLYRLKQVDYDGTISYSDDVEVEIFNEKDFFLYQNFPNPFNPSTTITYSVGRPVFVTLKVFDIMGNEVLNLVSDNKEPGIYNVDIVADKLTSGVYYYQLKAGSYSATKKFVLVR
jgi:hypothetical protein